MPDASDDRRPPMAVAMEWVSRITTISLEMVLPGIAGQWLDQKWGTNFLALAGFALGLTAGIWHLLILTRPRSGESPDSLEQSSKNEAKKAGEESSTPRRPEPPGSLK